MPKPFSQNADHFLNRLALQQRTDATNINPYHRLHETFELGDLKEIENLFNAFCKAAMRQEYLWKKGSPGNCLFIAEETEAVIESCYLIWVCKKEEPIQVEKDTVCSGNVRWSTRLTQAEWCNPVLVLQKFFAYQSLARWKVSLHYWLEAALSTHSVTTSVDPKEVLPFCKHLQKLLEAAHWIAARNPK